MVKPDSACKPQVKSNLLTPFAMATYEPIAPPIGMFPSQALFHVEMTDSEMRKEMKFVSAVFYLAPQGRNFTKTKVRCVYEDKEKTVTLFQNGNWQLQMDGV